MSRLDQPHIRRARIRPAGALAALLAISAHPAASQGHALWGTLEPGPHPVGFVVEYHRDAGRVELPERRLDGAPEARPIERLVQIGFWYPAVPGSDGEPMTLRDYVELQESGLLEDDQRDRGILTDRQRRDLALSWATWGIMTGVDPEAWDELLGTPMRARPDAAPAAGPFPLVLMIQGAGGSLADMMATAEYLASHGYVLVTVPSRGPEQTFTRTFGDPRTTESTLRDAEFALRVAAARPGVDRRSLAVLGNSRGGMVGVLLAMMNPSVDAVVGFDPPLGSALLTASPWFDPSRLRVPVLLFQAGARPTPAVLDQFPYAQIQVAGMRGLHHVDFGALGMIHTALGVRNRYIISSDEHIRTSVEWVNRRMRDFLDAHVKGEDAAEARFAASLDAAPDSVVVMQRPARPAPPASAHLAELAWQRGGIERVTEVVRATRRADPTWLPFAEAFLNSSAYRLVELGRTAEAVGMARLNVELYPESANAHDTLGDILAAAGERDAAIRAYERGVELDPTAALTREKLESLRSARDGAQERP